MKHFLDISDFSKIQIENLIERAFSFKKSIDIPTFSSSSLATLFYENSTRTRVSFELAAKRLGITTVNIDIPYSSESKGELSSDTFSTLAAMGISVFVIRHKEERFPHQLAMLNQAHIVNAGDGKNSHPSQALLDVMTILENKKDLAQLKIAIVGDLLHSRVANSLQAIFSILGVGELVLVAPQLWLPEKISYGRTTSSLKEGIKDADVVICLRVQKERLLASEHLDLKEYQSQFCVTEKILSYAKPNVMLMHPGPINRDLELTSEAADSRYSYILKQVQNGVFARMSILNYLLI